MPLVTPGRPYVSRYHCAYAMGIDRVVPAELAEMQLIAFTMVLDGSATPPVSYASLGSGRGASVSVPLRPTGTHTPEVFELGSLGLYVLGSQLVQLVTVVLLVCLAAVVPLAPRITCMIVVGVVVPETIPTCILSLSTSMMKLPVAGNPIADATRIVVSALPTTMLTATLPACAAAVVPP